MRVSSWIIASLFLAATAMIVSLPAGEQYQSGSRGETYRTAPADEDALPMRQPGMQREGAVVKERSGQLQITKTQFRASQLMGLEVKNRQNENLGEIHDIVIGPAGVVRYVALSSGGLLGIGETLSAVPWTVLHLEPAKTPDAKITIVLDISAERFKQAPTFSENEWPNFESPQWVAKLESFYRVEHTAMRPESERGFFQQQQGQQQGQQPTQPGLQQGQRDPSQQEQGLQQEGQQEGRPGTTTRQNQSQSGQQEQQQEDQQDQPEQQQERSSTTRQ